MGRYIYCGDCEPHKRALFEELRRRYPAEEVRLVSGQARIDMRCDECNRTILPQEDCLAVSIYDRRQKFPEWEGEYLEVKRP